MAHLIIKYFITLTFKHLPGIYPDFIAINWIKTDSASLIFTQFELIIDFDNRLHHKIFHCPDFLANYQSKALGRTLGELRRLNTLHSSMQTW